MALLISIMREMKGIKMVAEPKPAMVETNAPINAINSTSSSMVLSKIMII